MSQQLRRSLAQMQYDQTLERTCPIKVKLVRALTYNCSGPTSLCFQNGRTTINPACPVCAGTGYLGVEYDPTKPGQRVRIVTATGALYDDTQPPASNSYLIYGDIQTGHGLYGAGGDFLALIADLGRQPTGDATFFCKMFDTDRASGQIIYPLVDENLVRPDRVISADGTSYNVVRQLIISNGSEYIGRSFTLESGSFVSKSQGGGR